MSPGPSPGVVSATVASLALRLPRLDVAVAHRPADGNARTASIFRPSERAPLYLAAVSLLDEIARTAPLLHNGLAVRLGYCAIVDAPVLDLPMTTGERARRWLDRIDSLYPDAYTPPIRLHQRKRDAIRAAAVDAATTVAAWDRRAGTVLGELVAAWPLRTESGQRAQCPAYPHTGGTNRCGLPLVVVPEPDSTVPWQIACEARPTPHAWTGMSDWLYLGKLLATTARPAGTGKRRGLRRPTDVGGRA